MTTSPFSASTPHPRARTDPPAELDPPATAAVEPPLRLIQTDLGAHTVLALVGEIDLHNSHVVAAAVRECLSRQPASLSLDLSGLTYCGAAGMHSLRAALRHTEAHHVTFHIVASPAWLRRALTASQARELLVVCLVIGRLLGGVYPMIGVSGGLVSRLQRPASGH